MQVFQVLFILHDLKTSEANCQARWEQTNRRASDTSELVEWTQFTLLTLVGHSFENFIVNEPFDCHLLCFIKKCRCQAYQIKGRRAWELLDEDSFAVLDGFVEEQDYEYFDMDREYEISLRKDIVSY